MFFIKKSPYKSINGIFLILRAILLIIFRYSAAKAKLPVMLSKRRASKHLAEALQGYGTI